MRNSDFHRLEQGNVVRSTFDNGGNKCSFGHIRDALQQSGVILGHAEEKTLLGALFNCSTPYSDNDIRVRCEKLSTRAVERGLRFRYVSRGPLENRVDYHRKYGGNCDLDVPL